jgi:hypothetical protein
MWVREGRSHVAYPEQLTMLMEHNA